MREGFLRMRERPDIAALMPAVARALLGEPVKALSSPRDWRWGKKGSMSVSPDKGTWFDHEAGCGGGVIDLIRRERSCDVRSALEWLESIGEHVPVVRDTQSHAAPRKPDLREAGLRIWHEAREIEGTLAHQYLRKRGLSIVAPAALKFHPRCPFGKDDDGRQMYLPCMIGLFRSVVTGQPLGVHRTALTGDAAKIGRKMLGPVEGAAIMLSESPDVDGELGICEGIETGLALLEMGHSPIWALGAAGKIARLPIVYGIKRLVIWTDHDEAGLQAADECGARWVRAGVDTVKRRPKRQGADFLDTLQDKKAGR